MMAVTNPALEEAEVHPETEEEDAEPRKGGRPKGKISMSAKQFAIHEFLARFSMDDATSDLLKIAEKEGVPVARHHIEHIKNGVISGQRKWPEPLGSLPATMLNASELIRRWPEDTDADFVVRELAKQGITITKNYVATVRSQARAKERLVGETTLEVVAPAPPSEPLTASEAILRAEESATYAGQIAKAAVPNGVAAALSGEPSKALSAETAIMACVLEIGLPAVKQILFEIEERVKEIFK